MATPEVTIERMPCSTVMSTSTTFSLETWMTNPPMTGLGAIGMKSVTMSSWSASASMSAGDSAVLNATVYDPSTGYSTSFTSWKLSVSESRRISDISLNEV